MRQRQGYWWKRVGWVGCPAIWGKQVMYRLVLWLLSVLSPQPSPHACIVQHFGSFHCSTQQGPRQPGPGGSLEFFQAHSFWSCHLGSVKIPSEVVLIFNTLCVCVCAHHLPSPKVVFIMSFLEALSFLQWRERGMFFQLTLNQCEQVFQSQPFHWEMLSLSSASNSCQPLGCGLCLEANKPKSGRRRG